MNLKERVDRLNMAYNKYKPIFAEIDSLKEAIFEEDIFRMNLSDDEYNDWFDKTTKPLLKLEREIPEWAWLYKGYLYHYNQTSYQKIDLFELDDYENLEDDDDSITTKGGKEIFVFEILKRFEFYDF